MAMFLKTFIAVMLGGVLTFYINHDLKKGAVFASAIVAVCFGLFLPLLFGDLGSSMVTPIAVGSYAGMSGKGKNRVGNYVEMIIVAIFASILFIFASDAFVGVGGKLGTIACFSVIALCGMKRFFRMVLGEEEKEAEDLN